VPLFSLLLFIFSVLILLAMFYISTVTYIYLQLGFSWTNWINIAIGTLCIMVVFFAVFSWNDFRLQTVYWSTVIIIVCVICILILRAYAVKILPRVNFFRPFN
jgi:hypothetical protein